MPHYMQQAGRMADSSVHVAAEHDIDTRFDEIAKLLNELHVGRAARMTKLYIEGKARLAKEEQERELARIERERRIEEERRLFEEEEARRQAEIRKAEAQVEEERRKRDEARRAEEKEQQRRKLEADAAADAAAQAKRAEEEKARAREAEARARKEELASAAKRAEEERAAKNAAAHPNGAQKAESKVLSGASISRESAGPSAGAEADYKKYVERIEWIKRNVREAVAAQPKSAKAQIMDIKLQLRPRFGQLTNSRSQLISCRDAVRELFSAAQQNQLTYFWLLNLYAKMLVEQSESEANVAHQNALPLAMLTILLWEEFPELGDFVIPRFVKRCPQLIGYHYSISTAAGRKRMGWKLDDETGKYETVDQYSNRLSGVCAVWACMTQTRLNAKNAKGDHPYSLAHSWTFLARTLNKPPSEVTVTDYTLVATWWDMTAMRLHEAFGVQGRKLLEIASFQWTEGRNEPPAMRLRGLGENWKTSGKIEAVWKPLQP